MRSNRKLRITDDVVAKDLGDYLQQCFSIVKNNIEGRFTSFMGVK